MRRAASIPTEHFMEILSRPSFLYHLVKRLLDVVITTLGIVVFFPVWVLIAIAVKVTSDGPILYVGDAIGKDGKPFLIYKFRTMRADSDHKAHEEYLERFVCGNEPYTVITEEDGTVSKIYKMVGDSRVTSIGKILRATGLDEAPQFLNVLKGEMSLVGPRPPRPVEYERYDDRHRRRLAVPPGITGLYQITARSMVPFEEMVDIDLDYICQRSISLDLKILLLTPIRSIILRRGGY